MYAVVIGSTITSWAPHAARAYFELHPLTAAAFILGIHLLNPGIPCALMLAAYVLAARRLPAAPLAVVGAALWVASEWMRTWSLGWELLAHSQYRQLALIQIADLGGAYAVSFVMALLSIAVAQLVAEGRRIPARAVARRLVLPVGLVLATVGYGHMMRATHAAAVDVAHAPEADVRRVEVVQASVPNQFRWKRAFFGRTLATYTQLTATTRGETPDLIVWPENAVSFYVNMEDLLRSQLAGVATLARDGLLIGAPRRGSGPWAYNSVYLFGADGQVRDVYDKQQLLPFGEYDPLSKLRRAGVPTDVTFAAGDRAQPLHTARLSLGTMICFEVLYPPLVRALVRNGAEILVNLSNDSWMDAGDGAALQQHFSMAVFRAVETRRYLVRAASSGVSGFVSPLGDTYGTLATNQAAATVAPVRLLRGESVYVRYGDWWILVALLAAGLEVCRGGRPKAGTEPARVHPKSYAEVKIPPKLIPARDFDSMSTPVEMHHQTTRGMGGEQT